MGRHICGAEDAEALDECGERYLKRCQIWVTVKCFLCSSLRICGARVVGRVTPFVKVIAVNVGSCCEDMVAAR